MFRRLTQYFAKRIYEVNKISTVIEESNNRNIRYKRIEPYVIEATIIDDNGREISRQRLMLFPEGALDQHQTEVNPIAIADALRKRSG